MTMTSLAGGSII